jgi:hypothetical protein
MNGNNCELNLYYKEGFEAVHPMLLVIGYTFVTGKRHAEVSRLFEVNLSFSCGWMLTYIALTIKSSSQ